MSAGASTAAMMGEMQSMTQQSCAMQMQGAQDSLMTSEANTMSSLTQAVGESFKGGGSAIKDAARAS